MQEKGLISIWFFIGVLLTAYGVLITASGIYQLFSPPEHPVVLANLARGNLVGRCAAHHWPCLHNQVPAEEALKEKQEHEHSCRGR